MLISRVGLYKPNIYYRVPALNLHLFGELGLVYVDMLRYKVKSES